MAGAAADTNVVFLRDRIFLRDDALSCLLIEFDTSTKILLCPKAKGLALVQSEIRVDVDLEWPPKTLIFFFYEDS